MHCEGVREPRFSIVTCMSYMAGRVGPAGLNLFAATEEHTTGVYLVRLLPRTVSRSDMPDWKHQNKSEEWNDGVPVIKDTHASGRESMDMILSECLNAVNEMARHCGFASVHRGEQVRRAALRRAAGMVGSYQVRDTVSYCREARAGEHGLQWSFGSTLIGFEKDRNSLSKTQPCTCWIICDSVPGCVAGDRLRRCTPAELLAFHHTQTKSSSPFATDAQIQQGFIDEGFIDERASLNPTTADPSRTADEGEDEDERDDEMSEPTRTKRTDKRKEIQTDETAKELRELLHVTDSSLASSLRRSDETQEQLERTSKQARTVKKGVETLQDVLNLFQTGHCEHQSNGFLQVRMAGLRRRKKPSLPILHARCASSSQRDETHRMEQVDEVQCRYYFDG